ncbi:zeta toxin family protein [Rhizobium sp.]
MNDLKFVTKEFLDRQTASKKPLAIVLAGHNGSGKSTIWRSVLAPLYQMPLINADRMMMSILPETADRGKLPRWAQELRDTDQNWMKVAQQGVEAFVAQAMAAKVAFAMETVFSDWRPQPNGEIASKIDLIRQLQSAEYFVLLIFVGLSSADLSILRVRTRRALGGHDVPVQKLMDRFPRTQHAISQALGVADASVLVDNSGETAEAFTVCRYQMGSDVLYDIRNAGKVAPSIDAWLSRVAP